MVTREEFSSRPERGPRIFERADADGDGQLMRSEVEAAVSKGTEERRQKMLSRMLTLFDEMDTDGNGVVTPAEMEAHAFARIDVDGDGRITAEEAEAIHERLRDRGEHRRASRSGELSE